MTAYPAENAASTAGELITERTGATSGDSVPAGSIVVWRNTGAGSHIVTLTTNNTVHGLAVSDFGLVLAAGATKASRIHPDWGAADGTVAVAIDGTATEVKYSILGGL